MFFIYIYTFVQTAYTPLTDFELKNLHSNFKKNEIKSNGFVQIYI